MRAVTDAADRTESIARSLTGAARELRDNPEDKQAAYARLYWLRADLGRVVASLGAGVPAQKEQEALS